MDKNTPLDAVDLRQWEDAMEEHPYLTKRVEETARKVDEIHQFIKGLGEALNSPMVRAMIPPHMRDVLGK